MTPFSHQQMEGNLGPVGKSTYKWLIKLNDLWTDIIIRRLTLNPLKSMFSLVGIIHLSIVLGFFCFVFHTCWVVLFFLFFLFFCCCFLAIVAV